VYHPLWQEALNLCRLPDYDDSPNVLTHNHPLGSGAKTVGNSTGSGQSTNGIIRKVNGEIFDKLGDFGNMSVAARISKIRQFSAALEKVASKTARGTKVACAALVETTNRLGSIDIYKQNVCIKPSALDKALGRHAKNMLDNKSPLQYQKLTDYKRQGKSGKLRARVSCKTCREVFMEPQAVYVGHRSKSSRCPHQDDPIPSDLKSPPETLGQLTAGQGRKRVAPGDNITQGDAKHIKTTKVNVSIHMEPVVEEESEPEEGTVRPAAGQLILVCFYMHCSLH